MDNVRAVVDGPIGAAHRVLQNDVAADVDRDGGAAG
jgi:hypothetical protein